MAVYTGSQNGITYMISDEQVKQLYLKSQAFLTKHGGLDMPVPSPPQFFRGVSGYEWEGQHPGSCKRHKSVFFKFNIIPEYCFGCYKVYIEPRTVVELFKLMVLLERLKLPNDNTRKCMVEDRKEIAGTYKGFVYCTGIKEGRTMQKVLENLISEHISEKIPVSLKRGCSEYALSYPEYAQAEEGAASMAYKQEWREYEILADREFVADPGHSTNKIHNHPGYNMMDARIMLVWLRYAATIGDSSYLKISGKIIPHLFGLERTFTSRPL